MYEIILERYKQSGALATDHLILHDGGKAFNRKGESVFTSLGFHNHETYPSDVHQFLSPNDNKYHGCKQIWYKEYHTFTGDESIWLPCRLMQLLDEDAVKSTKKYFQKNLIRIKKSDLDSMLVE